MIATRFSSPGSQTHLQHGALSSTPLQHGSPALYNQPLFVPSGITGIPVEKLSVATWNTDTLFYATGQQTLARLTRANRAKNWCDKLFGMATITMLQETKGHQGDLQILKERHRGHDVWGSFLPHPAGGVVIAVQKSLTQHCEQGEIIHEVVGREVGIMLRGSFGRMIICNIHLEPQALVWEKRRGLKRSGRCSPSTSPTLRLSAGT